MAAGHRVAQYCSRSCAVFVCVRRCSVESWLEPRSAKVIVKGFCSWEFLMRDMVYQGTVLGPPLWNVVFEDARAAINAT
eukprot:7472443-Alexandrium_andersonii.AAC.1